MGRFKPSNNHILLFAREHGQAKDRSEPLPTPEGMVGPGRPAATPVGPVKVERVEEPAPVLAEPGKPFCVHCGGHGQIVERPKADAARMVRIELSECRFCQGSGVVGLVCQRGGDGHTWLNSSGPAITCLHCKVSGLKVKSKEPIAGGDGH